MKNIPKNVRLLPAFLYTLASILASASGSTPNILFIAVDDLRPELGCYGNTQIVSPNIDRLAASGTVFKEAYCQVPVCGASRASLMTGLYPTRERFLNYHTKADMEVRGIYDLPGWLQEHGYTTISNGKIYHQKDDFERSWTEISHPGTFRQYVLPENIALPHKQQPPFEAADVPDNAYPDGKTAEKVIRDLERAKAAGSPFFIAAGFSKPHLPFNAPSKYWDLYDRASLSLPDNYYVPEGAPRQALHNWNELRGQYGGVPQNGAVSDELALHLIHGYYASVSYADAMIGKILDSLDRLGMSENTIVILWGDHGWQLGEHTLWCKHALFRTSLNAPLILRAPGYKSGQKSSALVEFVDIYPTLCELAGIDSPTHLQGRSLVTILMDPNAEFKQAIFSRYQSGEAVKTDKLSYARWSGGAEMLYDHSNDLDENVNCANDSKYAAEKARLSRLLRSHQQDVRAADNTYASSKPAQDMIRENKPPVWKTRSFSQKPARVGEAYSTYVNFRVTDPDGDGLIYGKVSGAQWLQLTNPSYGHFEGTPSAAEVGEHKLTVSVCDGINPPVEANMSVLVR